MSNQPEKTEPASPPKKRGRNVAGWLVMLLVVVCGASYGLHMYHLSQTRETTDNAQINSDITPISSRIRGPVDKVLVADHEMVKAGQLLFTIDPTDYRTKVEEAESALASAENALRKAEIQVKVAQADASAQLETTGSNVEATRRQVESAARSVDVARAEARRSLAGIDQAEAGVSQAKAGVSQAQAELTKAQAEARRLHDDVERYAGLYAKREVAQQRYEAVVTSAKQADAQVEVARQGVEEARQRVEAAQAAVDNARAARSVAQENVAKAAASRAEMQARVGEAQGRYQQAGVGQLEVVVAQSNVKAAQSEVQRAQAQLKEARENLSYTEVKAPVAGRVAHKNLQPGQYVEVGSPVMALVNEQDVWVVANFKETQMERIRVGQRATLAVDTYPDADISGEVASIQPGTGSIFSLLPPENASGNFVKVVQRIPVKIVIPAEEQKRLPLRPGMSVEATVWLQ